MKTCTGFGTTIVLSLASVASAGVVPPVQAVPEPSALLVWLGFAGIGAIAFWRRRRR